MQIDYWQSVSGGIYALKRETKRDKIKTPMQIDEIMQWKPIQKR